MVYLIKCEGRKGSYFKVGCTHNMVKRLPSYYSHNPSCMLLETVETYTKTKHQLENEIHEEIAKMGYSYIVNQNGNLTEWFFVPEEEEKQFEEKGLLQFKCCNHRKIYRAL